MENLSERELLYSPSKWVKRMSSDEIINYHVKFATEKSEQAKTTVPCTLDVPYGDRESEKYDFFGTDLPNDAPIFIYVHGGYWQELSRQISSYVVKPFYENGFKTVVLGYTLCPAATLDEIVQEIELALRKCVDYALKCGSKSIYLSGYSAGAHLIASMFHSFLPKLTASELDLFKAFVLCSGIYDTTVLIDTYINRPLGLDYTTAYNLSPMFQQINPINSLIYIVVGDTESPEFKRQSREYHDVITKQCKNTRFKIIEGVDHFSIVEKYSEETYELFQFILSVENETVQ